MKKQFPDLPAWQFDMNEVSAGVYEVKAKDDAGHIVSAKGIDFDAFLGTMQAEARKILMRRQLLKP